MLKSSLRNPVLRKRARAFGRLVHDSAVTPRTGQTHKPKLVSNGELGVTFIGHASFFIQIGGQNVIVDPNFARWLFVLKRLKKPGVQLGDLPAIDLVLVTHAHFDHLHRPSLRAIVQQARRRRVAPPVIVVPHHVVDLVSDLGFRKVVELDWWDNYHQQGLTVTHVPSRHWGARVLKDSHRGYGGYVLRNHLHSVYHAGDTAYFPGFREIGRRLAPELAWPMKVTPSSPLLTSLGLWVCPVKRPCRSLGRHPRLPRPEGTLDGAHALRNVPFVSRAR